MWVSTIAVSTIAACHEQGGGERLRCRRVSRFGLAAKAGKVDRRCGDGRLKPDAAGQCGRQGQRQDPGHRRYSSSRRSEVRRRGYARLQAWSQKARPARYAAAVLIAMAVHHLCFARRLRCCPLV